jgi:replicative DNA helicase
VLSAVEWTSHLFDYLGQARTDGLAGVSTGLKDLDTMTLGLSPGQYLLPASTGTGKTALASRSRCTLPSSMALWCSSAWS